MNKKLMIGLAGFLVGGCFVALGTRAYFSQQGEVKSNTFSTGTLVLKLNSAETATAAWKIETGKPGDEVTGTVNIRNDGDIKADHIEIQASNAVIEATSGPGTEAKIPLDTVLEIKALTYDGVDVLDKIADKNDNGIKDLDDLEPEAPDYKPVLDNLALTDLNVDHPLAMTIRFEPAKTVSEHQGDSATTTLTVTLNQDSSQ